MREFSWRSHVHAIANQDIANFLKTAQLSQAMLESGRGTSLLFLQHCNPYGLKYRSEMHVIAKSILYRTQDGVDNYCQFHCEKDAAIGYWMFINRRVYDGWKQAENEHQFIAHLVACGYAGGNDNARAAYLSKVFSLFPESRHILSVL